MQGDNVKSTKMTKLLGEKSYVLATTSSRSKHIHNHIYTLKTWRTGSHLPSRTLAGKVFNFLFSFPSFFKNSYFLLFSSFCRSATILLRNHLHLRSLLLLRSLSLSFSCYDHSVIAFSHFLG